MSRHSAQIISSFSVSEYCTLNPSRRPSRQCGEGSFTRSGIHCSGCCWSVEDAPCREASGGKTAYPGECSASYVSDLSQWCGEGAGHVGCYAVACQVRANCRLLGTLVLAEHSADALHPITLNAVTAASTLGEVSVVVAGANVARVAEQVRPNFTARFQ